MKRHTFNIISKEIMDLGKYLDLTSKYIGNISVTLGLVTTSVILRNMASRSYDDKSLEDLKSGQRVIESINAVTGDQNHFLELVIDQLDMIITGNIMSEDI